VLVLSKESAGRFPVAPPHRCAPAPRLEYPPQPRRVPAGHPYSNRPAAFPLRSFFPAQWRRVKYYYLFIKNTQIALDQ
jgi:hypothetical protein